MGSPAPQDRPAPARPALISFVVGDMVAAILRHRGNLALAAADFGLEVARVFEFVAQPWVEDLLAFEAAAARRDCADRTLSLVQAPSFTAMPPGHGRTLPSRLSSQHSPLDRRRARPPPLWPCHLLPSTRAGNQCPIAAGEVLGKCRLGSFAVPHQQATAPKAREQSRARSMRTCGTQQLVASSPPSASVRHVAAIAVPCHARSALQGPTHHAAPTPERSLTN